MSRMVEKNADDVTMMSPIFNKFPLMLKQRWFQGVMAVLYCMMVLGFMLGARPLSNPDETRYTSISVAMLRSHDFITPRINGFKFLDKPDLFYWVQAAGIHFWGLHVGAFRLAPALFAIIAALAVFFFALSYYDRKTAWLSLLVLSSSPLYYLMGRYVNMDMAIASMITLTLIAFHSATLTQSNKNRKMLVYAMYLFAGLGFLTKGLIGFVIPGTVIFVWMLWQRQWPILKWLISPVGILIFLLVTVPWLIAMQMANPNFFHYFFIFEQFNRFAQTGFNNQMPWWFYLPVILAGMLPWCLLIAAGICYSIFKVRNPLNSKDAFWYAWIFTVLLFFSIPQSKIASYILPLFPPMAILTARFMTIIELKPRIKKYMSIMNLLLLTLLTVVAITVFIYFRHQQHVQTFAVYIAISIAILVFATLANLLFFQKDNWLGQILTVGLSALLILATLNMASANLKLDDSQIFIRPLNEVLTSRDQLISYDIYPWVLPIYIDHRIGVVANWGAISKNQDNWKGHFQYSATKEDKADWMLTPPQFWQLWFGPSRIYLLIPMNVYGAVKSRIPDTDNILAYNSRVVLLVNHLPGGSFIPAI